jgi:hypothetical protein
MTMVGESSPISHSTGSAVAVTSAVAFGDEIVAE